MEVDIAPDGLSGIELVRRVKPDVVITDLMMPGMDGRAAIRALRDLEPGLEFIAVSGGATPEEIAQLEALGIVGFLRKPFSVVEMMEALQKAQANRLTTGAAKPPETNPAVRQANQPRR
jgi:two-component system response regulator YesN